MSGVITYFVEEGQDIFLMVLDDKNGTSHRFPIDARGCARINAEAARIVNSSLGGYNKPASDA